MRKLTRLQSLIAGTAFATAGVFGAPAAALAADSHAATTTDQAVTATVADTHSAPAATAPQAPADSDLHPVPVTADQTTTTPDHDQLANAKAIVDTAKDMNLPPRAYEIAVATSLQESNLHNLGNLGANNDHDSLGLCSNDR